MTLQDPHHRSPSQYSQIIGKKWSEKEENVKQSVSSQQNLSTNFKKVKWSCNQSKSPSSSLVSKGRKATFQWWLKIEFDCSSRRNVSWENLFTLLACRWEQLRRTLVPRLKNKANDSQLFFLALEVADQLLILIRASTPSLRLKN